GGEAPLPERGDAPAPEHGQLAGWALPVPGLMVLALSGLDEREGLSAPLPASREGGAMRPAPRPALDIAQGLLEGDSGRGVRLALVVNDDTNPNDADGVLWTVLNNIDPERDARLVETPTGPALVLDGTRKHAGEGFGRTWPPKIRIDAGTVEKVSRRWREYGLD
ncbi:MAG TPA: hypothetical protein VHN99_08545, partial [Deinococcales bacterium]|nr:hypothetical protein [Deinococcales bacterium]